MTHTEHAAALRADTATHYNCAQSVLIPFAAQTGLNEEQAMALAENFGAAPDGDPVKLDTSNMEPPARHIHIVDGRQSPSDMPEQPEMPDLPTVEAPGGDIPPEGKPKDKGPET